MASFAVFAQEGEEPTEVIVQTTESCADLGPLCNVITDWTGNESLAVTIAWLLGTPLKIVIIAVLALLLNRWARKAISRLTERLGTVTADTEMVSARSRERAEERASTIGSLLRSVTSGLIFGVAVVMILAALGISIMPIIASAGILGLAIGFGAQSVVEDFLRGIFMLGEDQFGVGDRVDVGTVNGYVERVTLRTTVIRDPNGMLWHMPNSEINHLANEHQGSNRAVVEIGIPYGSDMRAAMEVLHAAASRACADPEWSEKVERGPQVRGIQDLADHDVAIRVQVWVEGGSMRPFQRHLRLYLQEGLDEAGYGSPNPAYDIYVKEGGSAAA